MMRKALYAVMLIVLCSCNRKPFETIVFQMGENGYSMFRIPAIVCAPDGTLLAFAEGRKNGSSDAGDIDVVMKKSYDSGRTWEDFKVIWDEGENTCGNPAPVFDENTGRLIMLMTWNLGSDTEHMINAGRSTDTRRVFVISSDDLGQTWTEPRELTSELKDPSWTWFATGPCHAIQKKHEPHKGRIVVSCNYNDTSEVDSTGLSYSYAVYSDDGGRNWNAGASAESGGNESTIAELSDGRLLLNMRNWRQNGKRTLRRMAFSCDGGASWSETFYADSLYEPICQGSLLSYGDILLFSNPHACDDRRNMTISRSDDGGLTWSPVLAVTSDRSAYSDMTVLTSGDVGLLYEYIRVKYVLDDDIRFRYVVKSEILKGK